MHILMMSQRNRPHKSVKDYGQVENACASEPKGGPQDILSSGNELLSPILKMKRLPQRGITLESRS